MISTKTYYLQVYLHESVCQSLHNNILETFHPSLQIQLLSNTNHSTTVVHQVAPHLLRFIRRLRYAVGMS